MTQVEPGVPAGLELQGALGEPGGTLGSPGHPLQNVNRAVNRNVRGVWK